MVRQEDIDDIDLLSDHEISDVSDVSSSEDEAEARGARRMSIAEAFGGVKSERSTTISDDDVSSNRRSIAVGIKYGCN